MFSISPELLFSQKGFYYKQQEYTNNLGQQVKMKGYLRFNYLDLPVLLQLDAGGLWIEGRPQISYLLGFNDNAQLTVNEGSAVCANKITKNNLNQVDIGCAAGIRFILKERLGLSLRYNGSLSRFAKTPGNENLVNARHTLFQATVGYEVVRTGNKNDWLEASRFLYYSMQQVLDKFFRIRE